MISIIIPTWNQSTHTLKCLDSLKKYTSIPYEVIWIDNGSNDFHHNMVKNKIRGFRHKKERHPKPLGFPKANNRGIALSSGDYIVMLNNDVEVMAGWDTELRAALKKGKGASGPVAIQPGGWQAIKFHPWIGVSMNHDHEYIRKFLKEKWGGKFLDIPNNPVRRGWRRILAFFCTMFNREVFHRVGNLDERFGVGMGEDDDFCFRMRNHGYKLWLCLGAVVKHALSVTMRHIPGGADKQLRNARKKIIEKYGPHRAHQI